MYRTDVTFSTNVPHATPDIPQVLELLRSGAADPRPTLSKPLEYETAPEALLDAPRKAVSKGRHPRCAGAAPTGGTAQFIDCHGQERRVCARRGHRVGTAIADSLELLVGPSARSSKVGVREGILRTGITSDASSLWAASSNSSGMARRPKPTAPPPRRASQGGRRSSRNLKVEGRCSVAYGARIRSRASSWPRRSR